MVSTGRRPASGDAEFRRRRAEYEHERNRGNFFHPRTESCPWCGAREIRFRIRVADTRQCKPGTFDMDECSSCGHVFQNPRLTDTGLAYYCRDVYDGLGREHYASIAERSRPAYRRRLRLLGGRPRPEHWLDVGARHGHFCREARVSLPGTTFHALDPSEEILRARDRGWVDAAESTPLIEFAGDHLAGFDVVSLIHYLERTTSPRQELSAVRRVLRPGGVVLIELVNPRSRYARLHGRFWYCWMAPQNLHLMPWHNMCELLEETGFVVSCVELGAANKPFDNLAALLTALNYFLPPARPWPWLRRPGGPAGRLLRAAAMILAGPLLGLALVLDLLLHQVIRRRRGGNTYRIVAVAG
ncbi:class I SAM-dependent methyltransferase [Amycolatopsis sp. NPDC049252]|uniref:class I SAM-dependent methyltransferase n=1 Tax=Amycolatopsis sp. NPDC049252 TaxID=3363933 RepID=UPI00371C298E